MSWQTLGGVAPADLEDARLQVHHAAQIVSAAGASLVPPRPDDSHPNLGWSSRHEAFTGHPLGPDASHIAGLRPRDLTLLLLAGDGSELSARSLVGAGFEDGRRWLGDALASAGVALPEKGLRRLPYDLPDHPVAQGAAFSGDPAKAFAELARWYADFDALLKPLAEETPGASEVRCWPHHFDLATLIELAHDESGSATKTVGIGLSPGDGSYAEPYLYVSPWPYPDASALSALECGHWHSEGFTAAILTGSDLVPADDQEATVVRFLDTAIAASRAALA